MNNVRIWIGRIKGFQKELEMSPSWSGNRQAGMNRQSQIQDSKVTD